MTRELGPRGLLIGAVIGALLAAGNVYLGTKIGIIENGGVTASLLALGCLSLVSRFGRPATGLEANTIMTVVGGAASMCVAAGLVGPIAALQLAGEPRPLVWVALWGVAVAVLGTLIVVPLRRLYLALPFPSATAAAEVVKSFAGDRALQRRQLTLLAALVITVAYVVARDVAGLIPATLAIPLTIGGAAVFTAGVSLSPLVVAAGVLTGPRMGASVLLGALLGWGLLGTRAQGTLVPAGDLAAVAGFLVWPGVTLMVAATLAGFLRDAGSLGGALRDLREVAPSRAWLVALALGAAAVLVATMRAFGAAPTAALAGILLSAVAVIACARAMGETDQPPVGPVGAVGQLAGAALGTGVAGSLAAGGVVGGAAMYGSALMASWKTGALLGASPRRQLVAHLTGVAVGAVVSVGAFAVLVASARLGSPDFPAPSAQSWRATAEALAHGLPPGATAVCAVAAVAAVVLALASRGWLPSPVAVGMGFILPLDFAVSMALGGALAAFIARRRPAAVEAVLLPVSAGVIVAEVLLGLGLPIWRMLS